MQSSKDIAASTAYLRNIKTTVDVFWSWIAEASTTLRDFSNSQGDDLEAWRHSEMADAFHEAVDGLCSVAGEAISTSPPEGYRQLHLRYMAALMEFAIAYRTIEAQIDASPQPNFTQSKELRTGVLRGLSYLRVVQQVLAETGYKADKVPDGPVLQA